MPAPQAGTSDECRLVGVELLGEEQILAGLAHEIQGGTIEACREWAAAQDGERVGRLAAAVASHLEAYHSLPRAFELAVGTFECTVSASCFAQLKRHRMGTLLTQDYDPALGITVPPSIRDVGFESELGEVAALSEAVYRQILGPAPAAAPYVLTNAHRRRVLLQLNVRELAHFSRLRQDAHAQWDIRALADRMVALVQERMPRLGVLLCGKDAWPGVKKSLVQKS